MHRSLHQFIATLLLCSLTLQSQPSYGVNGMPRQQNNAAGSAAMLEALQPEELSEFGIRSPLGLPGKLYSSDEESLLSDAQSEENIALLQDGAMEAGFWIVAPEAKVLQLAYKLGKAVKLGTKITKGGKVLIQITDKVVSKEAKVAIAKAGGRVVEKTVKTISGAIKAARLPSTGKIRFVPRPADVKNGNILRASKEGYVDKFGNVWRKGASRTKGQAFEWDVELSKTGKAQLGSLSKKGNHANVSLDGKITHQ